MLKFIIALAIVGLGLTVLSFVFVPASAPPPTPTTASPETVVANGKALFQAKGCAVCHTHSFIPGSGRVAVGPDLSNYRADPSFLQSWLNDPKAARSIATMPKLDLSSQEINSLIAFLNNPSRT